MTLSVLPDKQGNAIRSVPANAMSDQTPFKDRWGATRSEITYWRYATRDVAVGAVRKYAMQGVKRARQGLCRARSLSTSLASRCAAGHDGCRRT